MNIIDKIYILALAVLTITLLNLLAQGANLLMYWTAVIGIVGYAALMVLQDRLDRQPKDKHKSTIIEECIKERGNLKR